MGRLRTLPPRLKAAPTRAKALEQATRYGKGRGGRPWRRLRDAVLKRDGFLCQCEDCQKGDVVPALANEVDHIVPLFQGGSDDPSNLRAINDVHHKAKTQAEARQARG
jgi:5-methylcytosine-specific restriction protein A